MRGLADRLNPILDRASLPRDVHRRLMASLHTLADDIRSEVYREAYEHISSRILEEIPDAMPCYDDEDIQEVIKNILGALPRGWERASQDLAAEQRSLGEVSP